MTALAARHEARTAAGTIGVVPDPAAALSDNLAGLHGLLKSLVEFAGEKLAAIRRADADQLQRLTVAEHDTLTRTVGNAQERSEILARLAQSLQRPELARGPLSRVVEHLREPQASILRARGAALREISEKLQQKNQVVALVARDLHSHIRGIFAELAKCGQESVVYGPRGTRESNTTRSWVDAVG